VKLIDNWFLRALSRVLQFKRNAFHPLLWINGEPEIGEHVYIAGFSEIYAKGAKVVIGDLLPLTVLIHTKKPLA